MDSMMNYNMRDSPSQMPVSFAKHHLPYFTPEEVERMAERQRGKLSLQQEEKQRQQACGLIEAVGSKIGFPRKTIATGQNLYHRFHLFFPRQQFNLFDVCFAALYVSSKMHDTLKKPREILMASYAIRYPELAAKSKSIGGELDIDPAVVEQDRQHLLAVERLILETICFNFTSRMPFPYVIKVGKVFKATKKLTKFAWRLAIDSYRTVINLSYPPHVVALACLFTAALLSSFEQPTAPPQAGLHTAHEIAATLGQHGDWEKQFQTRVEDLEEIAHSIIDLLIQGAQNQSTVSPRTPSSPHPAKSATAATLPSQPPSTPYKPDQLMRLKIVMRESEHPPRPRDTMGLGEAQMEAEAALLGRNEGTVRFLFAPPGLVGEMS